MVPVISQDGKLQETQAREMNATIMRWHASLLNYSKHLDKLNVVPVVKYYYLLIGFLLC